MLSSILLFIPAGILMVRQSQQFIRGRQGIQPAATLMLSVTGMFSALYGMYLVVPEPPASPPVIGVFLVWGILFTVIDISNFWLPLRFTMSFTLSGLLIILLQCGTDKIINCSIVWVVFFSSFQLVRIISLSINQDSIGQGDIFFISGMSFWMGWREICMVAGSGFLLLFLSALMINKRVLPYAPYFFVAFALWSMTGFINLIKI